MNTNGHREKNTSGGRPSFGKQASENEPGGPLVGAQRQEAPITTKPPPGPAVSCYDTAPFLYTPNQNMPLKKKMPLCYASVILALFLRYSAGILPLFF